MFPRAPLRRRTGGHASYIATETTRISSREGSGFNPNLSQRRLLGDLFCINKHKEQANDKHAPPPPPPLTTLLESISLNTVFSICRGAIFSQCTGRLLGPFGLVTWGGPKTRGGISRGRGPPIGRSGGGFVPPAIPGRKGGIGGPRPIPGSGGGGRTAQPASPGRGGGIGGPRPIPGNDGGGGIEPPALGGNGGGGRIPLSAIIPGKGGAVGGGMMRAGIEEALEEAASPSSSSSSPSPKQLDSSAEVVASLTTFPTSKTPETTTSGPTARRGNGREGSKGKQARKKHIEGNGGTGGNR